MPEIPDVEVYKRYVDATSLHQRIQHVSVETIRLLKGVSKTSLGRYLHGHCLEKTKRHGKYLFVQLDAGKWLVLHFGMTGDLKYFRHGNDKPDYTRVLFDFDNGYHLAYISKRKLGAITLTDQVSRFVADQHLGPDALDMDLRRFKESTGRRRGSVKTWLMNQTVVAGIGNVYSDEILFQARIHPRRKVGDLSEADIERLYRKLRWVIERAIEAHAEPVRMPDKFLTTHRHKDDQCPKCRGPLEHETIGGRTAYFCAHCQN